MQPDTAIMAAILEQAGREIVMPAFDNLVTSSVKDDGSVVTETDLRCQTFIAGELRRLFPDYGFLGEEMSQEEQQCCLDRSGGRFWCLDPLDGTTNFVARVPIFALSLALIDQGRPHLACIHDPVRRETFAAQAERGSTLNGTPMRTLASVNLKEAVGYIDFKRLPAASASLLATSKAYRSQRNLGTCALEWAWLAAGRAHFIVHGGEKIWDYAAGSLIAREAGCLTGNFAGEPLFPSRNLSSPILAACSEPLRNALQPYLDVPQPAAA